MRLYKIILIILRKDVVIDAKGEIKMNQKYTIAGTDISEVKRLNATSGLTYNQAKLLLAKKQGFNVNNPKKY